MAMMNPDVDGVRVARQVSSAAWMGETAEALDFHRLAAQATYTLDTQLGWRAGDVIAFAYGQRISAEFLNVHILLADRHAYGLQDDAYARRPDMTQLVELAAEKVELDEVTVTLDNQPAPIASFMACSDIDCRKVRSTSHPVKTLQHAVDMLGQSGISGNTAHAHVLEVDLTSEGITDLGQLNKYIYNQKGTAPLEVFINGKPLPAVTLAKPGHLGEFIKSVQGGYFRVINMMSELDSPVWNECHLNIGGGRDNVVRYNIFYNATAHSIQVDGRGLDRPEHGVNWQRELQGRGVFTEL
nr:hypothetical protein BaRGS_019557 [Batillaria attramentaria]